MGLDMFVYTTAAKTPAVDFPEPDDAKLLRYWRKHRNLHSWMKLLYRRSSGSAEDFNLVPVIITSAALERLETDIRTGQLPHAGRFFFGPSTGTETDDDLAFIAKARAAIQSGLTVYYVASW